MKVTARRGGWPKPRVRWRSGGRGGDGAQAQHLNQVVAGLTQASKKIAAVVKLISQIAAQTNLLALKADRNSDTTVSS